jgi:hypothetical protein
VLSFLLFLSSNLNKLTVVGVLEPQHKVHYGGVKFGSIVVVVLLILSKTQWSDDIVVIFYFLSLSYGNIVLT